MIFTEFLSRDLALIQLRLGVFRKGAIWNWNFRDFVLCCQNSGLNLWKVGGDHELFDLDTIKSLQKPCIFNGLYMTHIFWGLKIFIFPWVLLGSKGFSFREYNPCMIRGSLINFRFTDCYSPHQHITTPSSRCFRCFKITCVILPLRMAYGNTSSQVNPWRIKRHLCKQPKKVCNICGCFCDENATIHTHTKTIAQHKVKSLTRQVLFALGGLGVR